MTGIRQHARSHNGIASSALLVPARAKGAAAGPAVEPNGVLAGPRDSLEQQVRTAFSQHLSQSPYLPPKLAQALARDALSVALRDRPEQSDPEPTGLSAEVRHIDKLSDCLRDALVRRHKLPEALAEELALHGRERAVTAAIGRVREPAELAELAAELAVEHAITPTLLLRSLCLGQLGFFEAAMAARAGIPVTRVRALIYQDGPRGLMTLFEQAGLPFGLFRAFRATFEVIMHLSRELLEQWQSGFTDEIITRLVKEYEQVCPEGLEHVLSQLTRRLSA